MADRSQRTEEPTPKRRREARRDGQVARSAEVVAWVQVLAASAALQLALGPAGRRIGKLLERAAEASRHADVSLAAAVLGDGLRTAALVVAPLAAGMLVIGVVGNLAQVGLGASPGALRPKAERVSPLKGLRRVLSPQGAWEGAKVVVKVALLAAAAWRPLRDMTGGLVAAGGADLAPVLAATGAKAIETARTVAVAGLVLAAADYAFQRRRLRGSLMMTRQEVRDEHRQAEGDPVLRSHIRQRQLAVSRNRMIADVATASAVVVNPTHVAVALRYRRERGVPQVVAKGRGAVAARIRAAADEHGVPVVQDVPLARALHGACEVGQDIPAELYEAVARVLAFVLGLRGRPLPGATLRPSVV